MLAVSFDISNAFSSLPWDKIMESFGVHGVPDYLVRILRNYLRDRYVAYTDQNGSKGSCTGECPWGPC